MWAYIIFENSIDLSMYVCVFTYHAAPSIAGAGIE